MTQTPSRHIWYELMTTDADAAEAFYGAVLGWTAMRAPSPDMDYRQWSIDGSGVGGMLALSKDAVAGGMTPMWAGYLFVADVDASCAGVVKAGGAVHMPANDIPGVGRIAMVADPQGALFYVMTPMGEGESTAFAPGVSGHAGWNELHTSVDAQTALAFYAEHFGWGQSGVYDMGPMGPYLLFNTGGDQAGGIMKNPDYPKPAWLYYFVVDDINAATARVKAAGGTVHNGPHEVPTGDWVIAASDPQGARFALLGPNKG
jgi:predicted enzyme related to lactoylglutathione lyase